MFNELRLRRFRGCADDDFLVGPGFGASPQWYTRLEFQSFDISSDILNTDNDAALDSFVLEMQYRPKGWGKWRARQWVVDDSLSRGPVEKRGGTLHDAVEFGRMRSLILTACPCAYLSTVQVG